MAHAWDQQEGCRAGRNHAKRREISEIPCGGFWASRSFTMLKMLQQIPSCLGPRCLLVEPLRACRATVSCGETLPRMLLRGCSEQARSCVALEVDRPPGLAPLAGSRCARCARCAPSHPAKGQEKWP